MIVKQTFREIVSTITRTPVRFLTLGDCREIYHSLKEMEEAVYEQACEETQLDMSWYKP